MKLVSRNSASARSGKFMKLVQLEPDAVTRMKFYLDGRTDEKLNARFGIGYNTWRKIVAGQGVRASVADRLIERLSSLEASIGRHAGD